MTELTCIDIAYKTITRRKAPVVHRYNPLFQARQAICCMALGSLGHTLHANSDQAVSQLSH